MIKNKTWLDTHTWGVRAFAPGMKAAYNGFQFKRGWNTCPDWDDEPECGGGFHLMTPANHGFGFSGPIARLVEYAGRSVPLGNKIKVEKLRYVSCTARVLEIAMTRCGIRVPQDGDEITSGWAIILRGRPRITQSGGELRTYGHSQPRITQSGGDLYTYGHSQPRITQSGGDLYTHDQSQPRITQSGGLLYTCDQSQPRITQSGGYLYTCDQSQPRITRRSA